MSFSAQPGQQNQLGELLAVELSSAQQLMQILAQEHQLLIQGEADEIRAISREKQVLVQQMTRQLQARDRFLTGLGLPAGSAGTALFVASANTPAELAETWQQIEHLAPKLHDQNEVNGGIVSVAQRHVREALHLLIDQNEHDSTYGPGGTAEGRAPHSLAKA